MSNPTIISCAVTGNITNVKQYPNLPCTPEQIANACIGAAQAGAAIAHIHVRFPDGRPSMELEHYREVVERVRASDTDVIINLTTGPGQRFIPSEDDPKVAAPGTTLTTPERRMEHVVALRPEICSLDLNTMFSGSSVVINTPRNVRIMANLAREAGTHPRSKIRVTGLENRGHAGPHKKGRTRTAGVETRIDVDVNVNYAARALARVDLPPRASNARASFSCTLTSSRLA